MRGRLRVIKIWHKIWRGTIFNMKPSKEMECERPNTAELWKAMPEGPVVIYPSICICLAFVTHYYECL